MPDDSETQWVNTKDGGRLAYRSYGSGPAVLIVHGIGGHKEDWSVLASELAGHRKVYAIDMLGFGESSKDAAEITIRGQADALLSLLDAEKILKADVIGNSVGGWVAATFAATYPDRIGRLILADAAGFKAMFEGPPPVNFYPATRGEMEQLLSFIRYDENQRTAEAIDAAFAAFLASGDAVAAERVFNGMFASERLEDVVARTTATTLVIWGEQDKLFPHAIADLVAGQISGAEKILIPEAGHFPHLDNPAAFNAAVVAFLAG